jgi:hypothetical protein
MTSHPKFQTYQSRQKGTTYPASAWQTIGGTVERRLSQRIDEPFPVTVRGFNESGHRFRTDTVVDNLSAKGLFVRIGQVVECGARLFALIRLAPAPNKTAPAPLIALKGVVRRVVPLGDGSFGIGIEFTHHRFL